MKTKSVCKIVAFCLFFLLSSEDLKAQSSFEVSSHEAVRMFLDLGPSLPVAEELTFNTGVELESGFGLLQFRVSGIHEGLNLFDDSPREKTWDLALLYGWRIFETKGVQQETLSVSVLAGVSRVTTVRRGKLISVPGDGVWGANEYEKIKDHALGIPFEVSLLSGSEKFGVRIAVVGNINRLDNYAGIVGGFALKLF
jgi:hypothetical protein